MLVDDQYVKISDTYHKDGTTHSVPQSYEEWWQRHGFAAAMKTKATLRWQSIEEEKI